jgi:hypothetical protein
MSSSSTQQPPDRTGVPRPQQAVSTAEGSVQLAGSASASCSSEACGRPPLLLSAVVSSGGHSASIAQHRAASRTGLQGP